jgi:DNA polymerase-4
LRPPEIINRYYCFGVIVWDFPAMPSQPTETEPQNHSHPSAPLGDEPARKIIHIDMDAFYASVEERDHPEYRGRPLAVGGLPQKRGVISTANYAARKFGVRSAISSYRAMQLCPDLLLVYPRFSAYKEVSQQIRAVFAEVTDLIEPLSLDEAYLDVTENKLGLGSATAIAQYIKQRIQEVTELTASAGVSYNKFLAKVASDYQKPDGLCVIPPAKAEAFIAQLPIGKFYGIGQKTEPRLKAIGIHTGADLKALSFEALEQIFGRSAGFYYGLARGYDPRPVETSWVRKSIGAENTFERDLDDICEMLAELRPLATEIIEWMAKHETYGRTLTLKVKYDNFQQITRSRTVPQPIETVDDMMALAEALLQTTEAGARKVRLLGLSMAKLTGAEGESDTKPPESCTISNFTGEHQLKLPVTG